MDNITILLHILLGGLTSGIAASVSPGKSLGIWGYLIGAITGLIGGLLFLDLIRPNDIIGSVIAAMFTALFFIFMLRWAEEKGLRFDRLSVATKRTADIPQLVEGPHEKKSGVASFFNIFDEDIVHADRSETAASAPLNNQSNTSNLHAAQKQYAHQTIAEKAEQNSNGTVTQTARGYDEDMFGQGVNSLQGAAMFDTDDEVPNLETPSARTTANSAVDKSRLNHALDILTSEIDESKGKERFFDRLPFRNVLRKSSANKSNADNRTSNGEAELTYVSLQPFSQESSSDEPPAVGESRVQSEGAGHINHADMTDALSGEDIYQEQYRFNETAVHGEGKPQAEIVAEAGNNPSTPASQPVQLNKASTSHAENGNEQKATGTVQPESEALEAEALEEEELEASEEPYLMPLRDYPDDLTKIQGIDKVYAQRLNEMGIYTWIQVADTEPPLLRDWVAAESTANVDEWPQLARSLAIANDRLEASYSGPQPDDLTEIVGITKLFEQRLNQMGIATFAQLAEADTKTIIRGLAALNVVAAAVYDWKILAKKKIR